MRGLLVATMLVASAAAAQAQQLASVRVDAHVTIPEFLSVKSGQTRDIVRSDGMRVRQVTVLVTANHTWNLEVVNQGAVVKNTHGASGNDVAVIVEIPWSQAETPPDPAKLKYSLTAG